MKIEWSKYAPMFIVSVVGFIIAFAISKQCGIDLWISIIIGIGGFALIALLGIGLDKLSEAKK
jgi:hypothetical protein